MFKCTIITAIGNFVVNLAQDMLLDGTSIETPIDAWNYIEAHVNQGKPLVGSDGLFSIERRSAVIAIKVEIVEEIAEAVAEPSDLEAVGFVPFSVELSYLGNPLHVEGVAHVAKGGFTHYLPTHVNGEHYADRIDAQKLSTLMIDWALNVHSNPGMFLVVMPECPLEGKEALEYLDDYMKEATGPIKRDDGDDAKAWNGWKERG